MQDSINNCDIIVVGSGIFGSVIAEQASRDGLKVLVLEQRDHIGGNCYSYNDKETDINIHKYGPHIFHTSSERVWRYINQFTDFNGYRHQCMSRVGKKTYSMPLNLATINQYFKKNWSPTQAQMFFQDYADAYRNPQNFEEQAMALMGNDLYRMLFREYTIKQWDKDPKDLPASVARRLPVRYNYNTRYYNDTWEGIPVNGYTPIFERMLAHPNIELCLNTDFFAIRDQIPKDKLVVYTGPIDRYFDYKYGILNWRTCDFVFKKFDVEDWQGVTQINYPKLEIPYTRTIEFRHFHPEKNYTKESTVVSFEYSRTAGINDTPYYPVNTNEDKEKFALYQLDAKTLVNTIIGGRLGEYMYYDMHQVIGAALSTYEKRIKHAYNAR
jgi:UDP-galactopyranose mutase